MINAPGDEKKVSVVKAALETDKSLKQIAAENGVCTSTVWKYLKDKGIRQTRNPAIPSEILDAAASEVESSKQFVRDIAEKHGISYTALRNELKKRGIKRYKQR